MKQVTVSRRLVQNRSQQKAVHHLKRCVKQKPAWEVRRVKEHDAYYDGSYWNYSFTLFIDKVSGRKTDAGLIDREWQHILNQLERLCNATRWGEYPWVVVEENGKTAAPKDGQDREDKEEKEEIDDNSDDDATGAVKKMEVPRGVHHAINTTNIVTLPEIKAQCYDKICGLLRDEAALREVFHGIFDREPQIRTLLSAVKSFLETDGKRRNHVLLYGLPACAKTQILLRFSAFVGESAVLRLDATSTTSAGIYKMFFRELQNDVPPFVIMEEMEKTAEEALRVWLGALDDRGELRKVNYREMLVREINILCLATANDKVLFDRLMGGREDKPGALSSRFVNQLECPRPDRRVLQKILDRDIRAYGGKTEWIEPALDLAERIRTNDPRKVLAFLDGGDRLLDGSYQRDIYSIYHTENV